MATYTIKYNGTTDHLAGVRETSKGSQLDYPLSACPTLSRARVSLATGRSTDDLREAVDAMGRTGRKVCTRCRTAAEAQLAAQA